MTDTFHRLEYRTSANLSLRSVFQRCRTKNHKHNRSGRSDDLYRPYQKSLEKSGVEVKIEVKNGLEI